MTPENSHSSSGPMDDGDAVMRALVQAYAAVPPPHLCETMDRAVFARMAAAPRPRAHRVRPPALPRPAISLAAALLLVLSGVAGYLHLSALAPVSAQAVLHHAAAVRMGANQAVHLTYAVTTSFAGQDAGSKSGAVHAGNGDVWIESDSSGTPILSSQTLSLDVKNIYSRYIQAGDQSYSYDPELRNDNIILIGSETRSDPGWLVPNHMFDGTGVAQYLNAPGQQQGVRLLPQQTLDGHAVDVVQVDGGPDRPALRTTFYFDARTYLLRGFDAAGTDSSYPIPEWRARLSGNQTMPLSAAPGGAFTLNAPSSARVEVPAADFAGFSAAFRTRCRSALNFKQAVASGRSPLAVCQESDPTVTRTELVDALTAPVRRDLEAAAARHQMSPQQGAAGVQDVTAQVTTMVTSSRLAR